MKSIEIPQIIVMPADCAKAFECRLCTTLLGYALQDDDGNLLIIIFWKKQSRRLYRRCVDRTTYDGESRGLAFE